MRSRGSIIEPFFIHEFKNRVHQHHLSVPNYFELSVIDILAVDLYIYVILNKVLEDIKYFPV